VTAASSTGLGSGLINWIPDSDRPQSVKGIAGRMQMMQKQNAAGP
jgi:hypothetical protein